MRVDAILGCAVRQNNLLQQCTRRNLLEKYPAFGTHTPRQAKVVLSAGGAMLGVLGARLQVLLRGRRGPGGSGAARRHAVADRAAPDQRRTTWP